VRKAIGARRTDIVLQFLIEASLLTLMGGLAGVAFGWIIALISRLVFSSLPAAVPMWAAVVGIVVSAAVGLFFGIWPASKAVPGWTRSKHCGTSSTRDLSCDSDKL